MPSFGPKDEDLLYGERLIPNIIDSRARHDPDSTYALMVRSLNPTVSPTIVTYGQLAYAINRCAFWLRSCVNIDQAGESIAYLGRSDLRIPILVVAAIKVDIKVGSPHI